MTDEERQRQMDFLVEGQARFDANIHKLETGFQRSEHETAQLRRVLLSAIRLGRRERSETREKINTLINAQIRTEEGLAAFQTSTGEILAAFKTQTNLLTKSLAKTNERVDALEEAGGNGGSPRPN